MLWSALGLT